MYAQKISTGLKSFVFQNWFKLLFLVMMVYMLFQKDLSFQINLSSPLQFQREPAGVTSPAKEKLSEGPGNEATGALFDRLPFPSEREQKSALKAELKLVHEDEQIAYLRRFAQVAIAERKKFGIPASILLANALLFSNAGNSMGVASANNHFQLECSSLWAGNQWKDGERCLRSYQNAWESFRDHSEFLSAPPHIHLLKMGSTDYKAWAKGMEKAGFQNEPDLAATLIEIIEHYRLGELDSK